MKQKVPSRAMHIAIGKMLGAMVQAPQSIQDLVEVSGLNVTTVRHYVIAWRKAKAVYVAEWQADQRSHLSIAAYSLGSKKDAVRQRGKTPAAIRWKQWEEKKAQQVLMQRLAA